MICSKCKTQVEPDAFENVKFCPHCGNKIELNRCSRLCKSVSVFDDNEDENEPRILNDTDLYCKYCGAKSTYFIQGILEED